MLFISGEKGAFFIIVTLRRDTINNLATYKENIVLYISYIIISALSLSLDIIAKNIYNYLIRI